MNSEIVEDSSTTNTVEINPIPALIEENIPEIDESKSEITEDVTLEKIPSTEINLKSSPSRIPSDVSSTGDINTSAMPELIKTNKFFNLKIASYSNISVLELACNGILVMRRLNDSYINATQILRAAGLPKPQRTRILERDVTKGIHEKVQGGYAGFQGTWVPLENARRIAYQHGVGPELEDIFAYEVDDDNLPPLKAATKRPYAKRESKKKGIVAAAAAGAAGTETDIYQDTIDGDNSSYFTDDAESISRPNSRASSNGSVATRRTRRGRKRRTNLDSPTSGSYTTKVESPKRRRVNSSTIQSNGAITPLTSTNNSRASSPLPSPSPKKGRICESCGITTTSQWRRGPSGKLSLCNSCGLKWNANILNGPYNYTPYEHEMFEEPAYDPSFVNNQPNVDYDAIDFVNQSDFLKKRMIRNWNGSGDDFGSPRSEFAVVPGSHLRQASVQSNLFNEGSINTPTSPGINSNYDSENQFSEFKSEFEKGQSKLLSKEFEDGISPKKRRGRPPKNPKKKPEKPNDQAPTSMSTISPSSSPKRNGPYANPYMSPPMMNARFSNIPPPMATRFAEDDEYYPPPSPTTFGTPTEREVLVATKRVKALLMLEETLNDEYGAILSGSDYEDSHPQDNNSYLRMQMHRDHVLAEYHRKKARLRRNRYYQESVLLSRKFAPSPVNDLSSSSSNNDDNDENLDYNLSKIKDNNGYSKVITSVSFSKDDEERIVFGFVQSVKKYHEKKEDDIKSLQYAGIVM